jgi:hypothetical protein
MVCLDEGRAVRAVRTVEGVESDDFCCERGHTFSLDWQRGPATETQWPLPPDRMPPGTGS